MKLSFADQTPRAQPDPFMCEIEGGWAMYASGVDGVQAYWAPNPMGPWEYRGAVLRMEQWRDYWAPCMYYEDGWYYIYFSGFKTDEDESKCTLHSARSRTPFGPFGDVKRMCDCFSIDPHVVRTEAGLFLLYCMDRLDTDRVGTRVFVERLLDPQTLAGDPVQVVAPSFDEEIFMRDRFRPGQHWHTIEGPFWLEHEQWQYVMYSGACYQNDTYHIGYAKANVQEEDLRKVSFEKHTQNDRFAPLMTKNSQEEGVGHHSVICWEGQYYAVYHARDLQPDPRLKGDQRTARICKLFIEDGVITTDRE